MRTSVILGITVLLVLCAIQAEGGRRGGGGRSRSGGRSSWGSSSTSSRKNSGYGSGSSSRGGKKKWSRGVKTAAAVAGGAYVGYQLGKFTGRFGHWGHGGGWGHRDYNRWREQDGMLCRSTQDCTWMDPNLLCQDYEMDFSMSRAWFGGDFMSIIGECECSRGMTWDNWELRCENLFLGIGIAGILILLAIGLCCCGGAYGIVHFVRSRG